MGEEARYLMMSVGKKVIYRNNQIHTCYFFNSPQHPRAWAPKSTVSEAKAIILGHGEKTKTSRLSTIQVENRRDFHCADSTEQLRIPTNMNYGICRIRGKAQA